MGWEDDHNEEMWLVVAHFNVLIPEFAWRKPRGTSVGISWLKFGPGTSQIQVQSVITYV